MPIERYRDPLTGRWVSREVTTSGGDWLRELFGLGGKRESQELVQEGEIQTPFGGRAVPNWEERDGASGRTLIWDGKGAALSPEALEDAPFPGGHNSFQVRFLVPNSPDYRGGYASYDTLYASEWPPSPTWGPAGSAGIGVIIFSRY